MMCAVSVRVRKTGTFDAFSEAWYLRPWPQEVRRDVISRNEHDPDQVLTVTSLDLSPENSRGGGRMWSSSALRRLVLPRIAYFEQAIDLGGFFEVVEDLGVHA